ncbi:polyprotein [Phytophthora palmivora]|uniref:Polyprotein n=1 Tax=Phytophthora palmivora TaxID=4796 RepID=A0A2P4X9Z2_9STRA|nr:polyprotein [Phytophthora palmivora]
MTRQEEILDAITGSYWLSTIDLMFAYYQVCMCEEGIKFTSFQASNDLWESLQTPGNSAQTYVKIFRGLKNTKSLYNDIYIFTKSPRIEGHLDALREILIFCLCVNLSKCVFSAEEIPCLGDFVGRNDVRMDPDKVQTIKDWPAPRTQEELHSIRGLTGYIQLRFTNCIDVYLKEKNKRNVIFHFNNGLLKNFKKLKRRLYNPPVLYLPDLSQPMHLRTDAS